MLEYTRLRHDRRKFLAMTGLTLKEFQALLPAFEKAYPQRHSSEKTLTGRKRKRRAGGGRSSALKTVEQKLLFILVYQKTYPLQVVLGELFGLSQSGANQWIHRLLPVLLEALTTLGVKPERAGPQFAAAERGQGADRDYTIDGTERRRQRPKDPEKQGLHYSGKKKAHSDKNVVIVHTRSKRVAYLGPTCPGKTHDKKAADQERIAYPRRTVLRKDTGFQGYEPNVQTSLQAKKSRVARNLPQARNATTARYRASGCAPSMALLASSVRAA